MAHHQVVRVLRPSQSILTAASSAFSIPLFLAPALQSSTIQLSTPQHTGPYNVHQQHAFSTSAHHQVRSNRRDKNKNRGVSAMRGTGPRVPLSISKYPLPEPIWEAPAREEFKTRDDHGLWGFFDESKKPLTAPEDLASHGRAWTYAELSNKGWEDLWHVWWMCVRERNWLATENCERSRVEAGYGNYESEHRMDTVLETMKQINKVLRDRSLAHHEALILVGSTEYWQERLRPELEAERDVAISEQSPIESDSDTNVDIDTENATENEAEALAGKP